MEKPSSMSVPHVSEEEETAKEGVVPACCSPVPELLGEVVFEILSRLPLEDVLRCKTVCKAWRSIISDPVFTNTHASRAPVLDPLVFFQMTAPYTSVRLRNNEYVYYSGASNGLVCFQTRAPHTFVIVNDAIHKSLTISTVHRKMQANRASFCYIPSTGDYKIANFFLSKKRKKGFFEVITLAVGCGGGGKRIETPRQHREIEVPSDIMHHFKFGVRLQTGTMTHSIIPAVTLGATTEFSDRIATFNLETETFTVNSVPMSRFEAAGYLHRKFVWDDRLCWASVVENRVTAYVWEDYERDEWRKEEVILPISTDIGEGEIEPVLFADNILYLRVGSVTAAYDFKTGHLERTAHRLWVLHFLKPSQKRTLVSLNGMISECPASA